MATSWLRRSRRCGSREARALHETRVHSSIYPGIMGAILKCTACGRLFAERMASCPFCVKPAPHPGERVAVQDRPPDPLGAPPAWHSAVPQLPLPALEDSGPRLPPVVMLAAAAVVVVAAVVVFFAVPNRSTGVLRW